MADFGGLFERGWAPERGPTPDSLFQPLKSHRHLLVADGDVELSQSQLVHFTRSSIDLLLESVAGAYGERAVGVILTGTSVDGATGIRAIKRVGGVTMVQDPAGAAFRGQESEG